jgi:hypothetical protein
MDTYEESNIQKLDVPNCQPWQHSQARLRGGETTESMITSLFLLTVRISLGCTVSSEELELIAGTGQGRGTPLAIIVILATSFPFFVGRNRNEIVCKIVKATTSDLFVYIFRLMSACAWYCFVSLK